MNRSQISNPGRVALRGLWNFNFGTWIFLGLGLLALGISPLHGDPAPAKPPCCRAPLATGPYTDRSLYLLDSKWTSDVDREIKLGVLHGRPQVLAMFFTHCEYACPIVVSDMKKIEAALPAGLRDRVDFILVSFDTARDTSAALRDYRAKMKLAPAHWTLLRSSEDDVRELAALLGVNYQRDARGQFAHSNVITVLNAAGEIAHQQTGLNNDPQPIVQVLQKLPAPPAAKTTP